MACRDDPTIFSINLMNEPRCECHPPHIPLPANYTVLPSCQARAHSFALALTACISSHGYMSTLSGHVAGAAICCAYRVGWGALRRERGERRTRAPT